MGSATTNFYNNAFERQGYGDDVRAVQRLWLAGDKDAARKRVPIAIGLGTNLIGTDDLVRDRLRLYRDAGVTTLRVGLQPTSEGPRRYSQDLARLLELVADINRPAIRKDCTRSRLSQTDGSHRWISWHVPVVVPGCATLKPRCSRRSTDVHVCGPQYVVLHREWSREFCRHSGSQRQKATRDVTNIVRRPRQQCYTGSTGSRGEHGPRAHKPKVAVHYCPAAGTAPPPVCNLDPEHHLSMTALRPQAAPRRHGSPASATARRRRAEASRGRSAAIGRSVNGDSGLLIRASKDGARGVAHPTFIPTTHADTTDSTDQAAESGLLSGRVDYCPYVAK